MASTIEELLAQLDLSKFAAKFKEEDIDLVAAKRMTDDDFKELGLTMGARKKLVGALQEMGTAAPAAAPPVKMAPPPLKAPPAAVKAPTAATVKAPTAATGSKVKMDINALGWKCAIRCRRAILSRSPTWQVDAQR